MGSKFFLSQFLCMAFTVILTFGLASDSDDEYSVCSSSLYSCGRIQNIGYPFWGQNRPDYCGKQEFLLYCNHTSNETAIFTARDGSFLFKVVSINTSSHTMIVSRYKFVADLCLEDDSLIWNIPPMLKVSAPTVANISFFYGCPKGWFQKYPQRAYSCLKPSGTNNSVYYFDQPSEIRTLNQSRPCNHSITVPVNSSGLAELNKGSGTVQNTLLLSMEVGYLANFSACSKCTRSRGRCGSDSTSKFVCYSLPRSSREKQDQLPLIMGLGVVGVVMLAAVLAICWYRRKLKSAHSKFVSRSNSLERSASDVEKGNIYFGLPLFSYGELQEATDNFNESKELGDGGFGTVYYGTLKDGREVAVKRLYEKNYRRVEQFMNEVQLLTCLRHQNLVSLYGCTSHHSRELLLVYEYVPNGTVADHLYGDKAKSGSLPWPVRLRIATETASALCYLHASDIIHRDVKTNNILLDSSFSVKVADFGLSRLFPTDVTHVSTAPQGTPGYLDPEYNQCYQLTDKSDVYSFGVVLVELISSLPAVDFSRHRHEINLSNYAMTRIQRCAFEELVDPQLGFKSDFKVRRMTTAVGELAFQCLQHDKEFRPSMDEVVEILKRMEGTDYEALQAEEIARDNAGAQITNPQSSPIEDDHAKLLTDHKVCPPSPISVMDQWGSKTTTPSTSN